MFKIKLIYSLLSFALLSGCNTSNANNNNQSQPTSNSETPTSSESQSQSDNNSSSEDFSSSEDVTSSDGSSSSQGQNLDNGVFVITTTNTYEMSYYEEEASYVYGFVYMMEGERFYVKDHGTPYGYTSLSPELSVFPGCHNDDDNRVVIESEGYYVAIYEPNEHLLAFERLGTAKNDDSYSVIINDHSSTMSKREIPLDSADFASLLEIFNVVQFDPGYADRINRDGLIMYYQTIVLEIGDLIQVKGNKSQAMSAKDASILASIPVDKNNDGLIRVTKNGMFNVCYFPGLGLITISYFTDSTKNYVTVENWEYEMTVTDGVAKYEGIILTQYERIRVLNTDNEFVDKIKEGDTCLYNSNGKAVILEDGVYNIYYDLTKKEISAEKATKKYAYYLGGCASSDGNFVVNENNDKEVVNKGAKITKNDYGFYVIEMDMGDYSYQMYYGLDESVSSEYAENYMSGTQQINKVNKAGIYDVYFNTETKLIRIVFVEDLPEGPLESAQINCESKFYKMEVNPEDENEFMYKGLTTTKAGAYMTFYDKNYGSIDGFTLSDDAGTQDCATMMSVLIYLKYQGTYNIYLNRTTKVVRIELVSQA